MPKIGDDIDSWCGVCKFVLAHTIEAMVGDTPARVHCNTCNAQHKYRPYKPGESPRSVQRRESASRGGRPRKSRANSYQDLIDGKDAALRRRYSPGDSYSAGDLVDHPTFGVGVTTNVKDPGKIEVFFPDGVKTLVQGR